MKKNIVIGIITLAVVFGIMIFAGQALGENLENYVMSEIKEASLNYAREELVKNGWTSVDGITYQLEKTEYDYDGYSEYMGEYHLDTNEYVVAVFCFDMDGNCFDHCVETNSEYAVSRLENLEGININYNT